MLLALGFVFVDGFCEKEPVYNSTIILMQYDECKIILKLSM